jgi:hypothetical protein
VFEYRDSHGLTACPLLPIAEGFVFACSQWDPLFEQGLGGMPPHAEPRKPVQGAYWVVC